MWHGSLLSSRARIIPSAEDGVKQISFTALVDVSDCAGMRLFVRHFLSVIEREKPRIESLHATKIPMSLLRVSNAWGAAKHLLKL
jgi:hypothetical protein